MQSMKISRRVTSSVLIPSALHFRPIFRSSEKLKELAVRELRDDDVDEEELFVARTTLGV